MIPASPLPVPTVLDVRPGPALLSGIARGPALGAHRRRYGDLPPISAQDLLDLVDSIGLRGRGGAAFPFATKLRTVMEQRAKRTAVVVNLSEGEPASAKDSALARYCPHLVLDGAVAAAVAVGAHEVHVVLPGDRPETGRAMRTALAERPDDVDFTVRDADPRFVSGQAKAVIELLSGRPNLPVTTWRPDAVAGLAGRPTLFSNAETWARVGHLLLRGVPEVRRLGTTDEPGTALLTITTPGTVPVVREVEYGSRLRDALPTAAQGRPALVGGFHGSWSTWLTLASARVSVAGMRLLGIPLGAGVIHVPAPGTCPLDATRRIVDYLAGQSAGRCGPCLNGLPALAAALHAVHDGRGQVDRVEGLSRLVERRGACAHPDGTARLVRSLVTALPREMRQHTRGECVAHLEAS